jgi:hypothetical protein
MSSPVFGILIFIPLLISLVLWFVGCVWIFVRLEKQHTRKYEDMGRPTLFLRNSLENNWLFLRFLFRNEFALLGDATLVRVCNGMKIILFVYVGIFLLLLFGVFIPAFRK